MRSLAMLWVIVLAGCSAPVAPGPMAALPLMADADRLAFAEPWDAREFDIVTDPADPMRLTMGFVIPKENFYWLGIATSADGGQSWEARRLCGDPEQQVASPDAVGCPFTGAAGITDPSLAVLHDGTVLLLGVMNHGYDVAAFASRFQPGALVPESTTIIARSAFDQAAGAHMLPAPLYVYYNGKANVMQEPDGDRIHAVWAVDLRLEQAGQPNQGLPVWVTSDDGGRTWSAPERISGHDFGDLDAPFAVGSDIVQSLDGRLHVTWWEGKTNTLQLVTSPNDGGRWHGPRDIAPAIGRPVDGPVDFYNVSRPWLDIVPAGPRAGELVLVYDELREGDRDVMLIRSADDGLTWSAPTHVGHLGTADGQDETMPRSFIDQNGTLWVLYVTYDGQWRSTGHRMHLACSRDAITFRHVEVSTGPSPLVNVGDYNAVAQAGDRIIMAWEDGRGGPPGAHRAWQAFADDCP